MKTFFKTLFSTSCLVLLFQNASTAQSLFLIPTDEADRGIFIICALFSFITCLVVYAVKKKRRQAKFGFTSFLGALFSDFWFDEFVTRKILSLVYFFWYFACLTFIFAGLVELFQLNGLGLLYALAYLLVLIIGRVVLESFSAIFRIAENTTSLLAIKSKENQSQAVD